MPPLKWFASSLRSPVPAPGQVRVFVDDHGAAVSVQGAEATLVVARLPGDADQFVKLMHSGGALEGNGIELKPGDRVQVAVKLADGQVVVALVTVP